MSAQRMLAAGLLPKSLETDEGRHLMRIRAARRRVAAQPGDDGALGELLSLEGKLEALQERVDG